MRTMPTILNDLLLRSKLASLLIMKMSEKKKEQYSFLRN